MGETAELNVQAQPPQIRPLDSTCVQAESMRIQADFLARSGASFSPTQRKRANIEPISIRKTYKNLLLASLAAREMDCLAPYLEPQIFKPGDVLFDHGQKIDTVYFMEEGLCSIVAPMKNGNLIEVAIIGRDGFLGMEAVLGTGRSLGRYFVQIAGSGYAIDARIVKEQLKDASGNLRICLQRGVQGFLAQTVQNAACNRTHELQQRLARRLLLCHNRVPLDKLPITHEVLATMLGTNRSSVTVAAGMLGKAGLIEYSRGRVRIKDHKGLEAAACECYAIVHDEYARLELL